MYDIITVGSATTDVFIQTDEANIVSVEALGGKRSFMSYPYGAKTEISDFKMSPGGGAVNTACNFANLGFKTSVAIKTGDDDIKAAINARLEEYGVSTECAVAEKDVITGFSVILVSFKGDRTVLAHRGPNADLKEEDMNYDEIKKAKWIYIAPLNGNSTEILDELSDFAAQNGVKVAINIGTSSIKKGKEYLNKILSTAKIVVMNAEEASMLTGISVRPDTKDIKFSKEHIHPDIRKMLEVLKSTNVGIVVITDGNEGAYAYDGKTFFKAPEFPATVTSTLGAGDAFASTFVATYEKTGDIEKSLCFASVNAASVVEHFNAHDGLLTFEEIQQHLETQKDYKVEKFVYEPIL